MRFLTPSRSPNLSGAIRPVNVSLCMVAHTHTQTHTHIHRQDVYLALHLITNFIQFLNISLSLGQQPPAMGLPLYAIQNTHTFTHTHTITHKYPFIHLFIYLYLCLNICHSSFISCNSVAVCLQLERYDQLHLIS